MNHAKVNKKPLGARLKRDMKRNGTVYLLLLPAVAVILVFSYFPMYGIVIAFQDFKPALGFSGSPWVGFRNFTRFFGSYKFKDVLTNTLRISISSLLFGFPAPVILALILNQVKNERYKRVLQMVTYMPHFISTVVIAGMIMVFLNVNTGIYGFLMKGLGVEKPVNLLGSAAAFTPIYVISGIWQNAGWDSIIYLAALSGVDTSLYEAATVDGANGWKKVWYIDLPCLAPTMIILLILNAGSVMSVGFEKVFLLQNNLNMAASEVISTYVYKIGLINQQYGLSAAVGLFNTVINFILLVTVNTISKRVSETSLW